MSAYVSFESEGCKLHWAYHASPHCSVRLDGYISEDLCKTHTGHITTWLMATKRT